MVGWGLFPGLRESVAGRVLLVVVQFVLLLACVLDIQQDPMFLVPLVFFAGLCKQGGADQPVLCDLVTGSVASGRWLGVICQPSVGRM